MQRQRKTEGQIDGRTDLDHEQGAEASLVVVG